MKKTCEICGGSGQISYFQGESRFLLTTEECPECSGLGYRLDAEDKAELSSLSARTKLMPCGCKAELSSLSARTKLMPCGDMEEKPEKPEKPKKKKRS